MGALGDGAVLQNDDGYVLLDADGAIVTRGDGDCECCTASCPEEWPDWISVEFHDLRICSTDELDIDDYESNEYNFCVTEHHGTLPGGGDCISSIDVTPCVYRIKQDTYRSESLAITGAIRLDHVGGGFYAGTVEDAYELATRYVQICDDGCACGGTSRCGPGTNYDTTDRSFRDVTITASCGDGDWTVEASVGSTPIFAGHGRPSYVPNVDYYYFCDAPVDPGLTISCSCPIETHENYAEGQRTNDNGVILCDGTNIPFQQYMPDPSLTVVRTLRSNNVRISTGGGYATLVIPLPP